MSHAPRDPSRSATAHRVRLESLADAMNAAVRDAAEDGWTVQLTLIDLGARIGGKALPLLALHALTARHRP